MKQTFNEIIKTYGHINNGLKVWELVSSYDDLKLAMTHWLKGDINWTFNHSGCPDPETTPLIEKLIKINELGFVSTNGQPSLETQKSFIAGFLPFDLTKSFIQFMSERSERNIERSERKTRACEIETSSVKGFYYRVDFIDSKLSYLNVDTFPEYPFALTIDNNEVYTSLPENYRLEDFTMAPLNIQSVLVDLKCACVFISSVEFNSGSCEDLLLEFFSGL